jgi:hypothetical protein
MERVCMRRLPKQLGAVLVAAALGLACGPSSAQANGKTRVDIRLVLAVDVSQSMDYNEHELQKNGYVTAFRDPVVIRAITGGHEGRIAVTYLEWGGAYDPRPTIPWTIIDSPAAAHAFADRLASAPVISEQRTSISNALLASSVLLQTSNFTSHRDVIDVSGDGANNTGPQVDRARDEILRQGIIINGLPIMIRPPTQFYDIEHLDRYYKDCVIGGQGAFMAAVYDLKQLAATIRKKLVMEIAGLELKDGGPPVQFAEAPTLGGGVRQVQLKLPAGKYNCLAGEEAVGGGGYYRYP